MSGDRSSGWSLDRFKTVRDKVKPAATLEALLAKQGVLAGLNRADIVLRRSRDLGRVPIAGVFDAENALAQRLAFLEMEKVGADLLMVTPATDLTTLAEVASNVNRACGAALGQADARGAAEHALAAGATFLSVPSHRLLGASGSDAEAIDYVDRLIGYCEDNGRPIVREVAPAPPQISLAASIAVALGEIQLALDQGVRTVIASLGLRGTMVQDVAAMNVLRSLAQSWLTSRGAEFTLYVGAAGWPASAPQEFDRGFPLAMNNALSAALGRAEVYCARPSHATRPDDLKPVLDGIQAARQMFDLSAGQWLEASRDLTAAEDGLKAEVLALLGSKSGATLGADVGAIAGRLRATKPASANADELFASLPRMTPQGLVSTPLGPWSKQPLGGSAT